MSEESDSGRTVSSPPGASADRERGVGPQKVIRIWSDGLIELQYLGMIMKGGP